MILSSSLNSKKCWVASLSKLQDLVESFASFSNFPFQSEDSLRRKIFTYTAYSYECLLKCVCTLLNPIYCSVSIYKTCWHKTCWRYHTFLLTSLVTSLVFILVVKLKKADLEISLNKMCNNCSQKTWFSIVLFLILIFLLFSGICQLQCDLCTIIWKFVWISRLLFY